jgi:predicted metalloprotease with PDZ domain
MITALAFAMLGQGSRQIALTVDAREASRGLFHVREVIPVRPGPIRLQYPKYIPGEHSPSGPINSIIRFKVTADGQPLEWRRDSVDMFVIGVTIPPNVTEITVDFDQASNSPEGNTGSAQLARIKWNRLIWYPTQLSDAVQVQPKLILPVGWHWASALVTEEEKANTISFQPVSLTRLVDSPAQIGRYYKRYDVTGKSPTKHYIEVMADSDDALDAPATFLTHVTRLHEDVEFITGTRHYNSYRWLITLSDEGGSEGLEHHESSEDGVGEDALTSDAGQYELGDLLSHEYFHSYNGKFRRPEGLATPDFQVPMKDELLWVYEGLTQYMGLVLACRSGAWTQSQWREQMAQNYMDQNNRRGRDWRPLVDTAIAAQITYGARGAWHNARRTADYYTEMTLVWLEADMRIRQISGDKKSLFDFIRRFHGGADRGPELKPYTLNEVVSTLNDIAKYDWATFFKERVYQVQPELTDQGFTLGGWKLIYNGIPNEVEALNSDKEPMVSLIGSIGIEVREGVIEDVNPGSAADKAGLVPGTKILAVNGRRYTPELLTDAVRTSGQGDHLDLTVDSQQFIRFVRIEYGGGLRYPHLVRIPNTPDRLKALCTVAPPAIGPANK